MRALIAAGVIIAIAVGLVMGEAGVGATWQALGRSAINAALMIVPIVLVYPLLARRMDSALVAVGSLLLATSVMTGLPVVVGTELTLNWQGKVGDLLWVTAFIVLAWPWARNRMGLIDRPRNLRRALSVIVVIFVLLAAVAVLTSVVAPQSLRPATVEQWLYDSTVPNLTEELIWRGAMLAVLDQALGRPWQVLGARVGWGLIITSVAFGIGHGIVVTESGLQVELVYVGWSAICGALFAWGRALTGSLWLAFLAHCAPELGVDAGAAIAAVF